MKKAIIPIFILVLLISGCSKDTLAPVLEVKSQKVEIEKGVSYDPLSVVTAHDDIDGDISSNIKIKSSDVDTNTPGTYTVVFEVSDKAKNVTQSTMTVIVKERFSQIELEAIRAVIGLKSLLKNPDSLQIHSMQVKIYDRNDTNTHFKVDYSAQNGFGGMNRETKYIELEYGRFVEMYITDSLLQSMAGANYEDNSSVVNEDINIDKIMENLDKNL